MQATNVRWDDVKLFLAVLRAKNLEGAAKRLAVDASTVSRRLSSLEHELGSLLFERTREGLTPTLRAEELQISAEAMETAHAAFATTASVHESAPEGIVRITAPPGLADAFVAPALASLASAWPKIRVDLDASTRVVNLTRKEADIALRTVPSEGAELVTVKLVTTRWVLAGAKSYVAELGRLTTLDDVRLVDWGEDLAHLEGSRWLRKHARKSAPVLRTSHFASQLAAISAGLGLALVPEPYVALHDLARPKLSADLESSLSEFPEDHAWLVGHRALRHVPRVAVVWEHLTKAMGRFTEGAGTARQRAAALASRAPGSRGREATSSRASRT